MKNEIDKKKRTPRRFSKIDIGMGWDRQPYLGVSYVKHANNNDRVRVSSFKFTENIYLRTYTQIDKRPICLEEKPVKKA